LSRQTTAGSKAESVVVRADRENKFPACESVALTKGQMWLRYRHNNIAFKTILSDQIKVADLFAKYPPDPCGLGDLTCYQQQMNKRGVPGGRGADGRAGLPQGEGDPCLLGLPCGRIAVLPGAWTLLLTDDALDGALNVKTVRSPDGSAGTQLLAVNKGRIDVADGLFKPGALYGYELRNAAGQPVATGEFRVLAGAQMAALQGSAAQRTGGEDSREDAWLKTLTENGLEWNVYQFLSAGVPLP
jgi:hypothetical protein